MQLKNYNNINIIRRFRLTTDLANRLNQLVTELDEVRFQYVCGQLSYKLSMKRYNSLIDRIDWYVNSISNIGAEIDTDTIESIDYIINFFK